jgi:hypothetical protein
LLQWLVVFFCLTFTESASLMWHPFYC